MRSASGGKRASSRAAYSAAKHEGQPLYKLARKGAAAPAKVKHMEISQADTLDVSLPFVRFRVRLQFRHLHTLPGPQLGDATWVRSRAHGTDPGV